MYARCEAKSAPRALWFEKSFAASCEAKRSIILAHGKTQRVSDCGTSSVLPRTQFCFSRKAKDKALESAISEAAVASLSAEIALSYEFRVEAPSGVNSEATSLKEKALYSNKCLDSFPSWRSYNFSKKTSLKG